jgi:hypothetical protein
VQTVPNGGALILYHGSNAFLPPGVATSAPSQLLEFTIRDNSQNQNPNNPDIPTGVDIDISYLNAMYLPVGMETKSTTANDPLAGYIGTLTTLASFENSLSQFVTGSDIGDYFYDAPAGKGWPQFNLTPTGVTPGALIKIPGGANLFAESASTSIYKVNPSDPDTPSLTSSQQTSVTNPANNNYAAQEITDLFFGWAKFYEDHKAQLGKNYIEPNTDRAPVAAQPEGETSFAALARIGHGHGLDSDPGTLHQRRYSLWEIVRAGVKYPRFCHGDLLKPAALKPPKRELPYLAQTYQYGNCPGGSAG